VVLLVYIVALLVERYISEAIKECMKKDARDGNSLADLPPKGGVALCHQLVGIIPSKNKGHTLFSKSWA
jgi:hypothetical protein